MKWKGRMLSAWPGASMTTRAPKMVSGIPSVAAVGKAGAQWACGDSQSRLGGLQAQNQTFPSHVCLHKRCGDSEQWKCSECDLQGRNAPDEAGSVLVRAAEEVWRRADNLLCLGKNVKGFSLKISCKRKSKIRLFWGYCYVFLLYYRVHILLTTKSQLSFRRWGWGEFFIKNAKTSWESLG